MIELTREQALLILKGLSAIEGFLMGTKATGYQDAMDIWAVPLTDMLFEKLQESKA